jgi:plastocyanin
VRSIAALCLLLAGAAHADGVVSGSVVTDGKWTAVWLEDVPAAAWTVPRDKPQMTQHGARFTPEFLLIAVGQTVVMPNDDKITHNVFSVSPAKKFDLGHYPQGESRTVKFDKTGVVDLFCDIHDNMHALIVIAPSTFAAVVGSDGKFSIAGVPPGSYRLAGYSSSGAGGTMPVVVGAGAAAPVRLVLAKGTK